MRQALERALQRKDGCVDANYPEKALQAGGEDFNVEVPIPVSINDWRAAADRIDTFLLRARWDDRAGRVQPCTETIGSRSILGDL